MSGRFGSDCYTTTLTLVTISGADDTVEPEQLLALSRRYRFVEWGVLLSQDRINEHCYPSREWWRELLLLNHRSNRAMRLSLHVCGEFARMLLKGDDSAMPENWLDHQRIQINTAGKTAVVDVPALRSLMAKTNGRQFIFQIDEINNIPALLEGTSANAVPLYDRSSGCGVAPTEWPKASYRGDRDYLIFHGYCGGLGPGNLAAQLPLIEESAGGARFWVDMQSGVRAKSGELSLAAVNECLQICEHYISKSKPKSRSSA